MKKTVYFAVALLAIVHQDFWLWDNPTLIFNFLPIGLAYHILFSVLCSALWVFAVRFSWPSALETFAEKDRSF